MGQQRSPSQIPRIKIHEFLRAAGVAQAKRTARRCIRWEGEALRFLVVAPHYHLAAFHGDDKTLIVAGCGTFQFYFRTNLFDKFNISASTTLDPYQVDSFGRDISKYAWQKGKFKLGRFTTGSVSVTTTFKSKAKDPKKEEERKKQVQRQLADPSLIADQQRLLDYMQKNPSEFVDFNIPWQLSLSYSLYFQEQLRPDYSGFDKKFRSNLNFNGSFTLTPKWNFGVNGYYDFDTKKLQTFTMSISREMHCWQLSINVTPTGLYRYFNISISPKSSILQDLRINRTRYFNN